MEKVILILIVLAYQIVKAVRKSSREAAAKRAGSTTPAEISLGAVQDYTKTVERETRRQQPSERWAQLQNDANRFISGSPKPNEPSIMGATAETIEDAATSDSETVKSVLVPVAPLEEVLDQSTVAVTRRGIGLDKAALRTFVTMREILGPPRSKARFQPGVKK